MQVLSKTMATVNRRISSSKNAHNKTKHDVKIDAPIKNNGEGTAKEIIYLEGKNKLLVMISCWLILCIIASAGFGFQQYQHAQQVEKKLSSYQEGLANPFREKMDALEEHMHDRLVDIGKGKEHMLDLIVQLRKDYDDLEHLYVDLQKDSTCSHKDKGNDARANASSIRDDLDDFVYCWIDSVFGTDIFSSQEECNRVEKTQKVKCPFKSAEEAVKNLKLHPMFGKLEHAKSRERKKILNELSLLFHPDKIMSKGCPHEYGYQAMIELNKFR